LPYKGLGKCKEIPHLHVGLQYLKYYIKIEKNSTFYMSPKQTEQINKKKWLNVDAISLFLFILCIVSILELAFTNVYLIYKNSYSEFVQWTRNCLPFRSSIDYIQFILFFAVYYGSLPFEKLIFHNGRPVRDDVRSMIWS
jgi:hypothetical protein